VNPKMNIAITLLKQKEFNINYNLENAKNICKNAFNDKADLVLLPEFFNLGLNVKPTNPIINQYLNLLNKTYSKKYYPLLKLILQKYSLHKNYIAKDIEKYLQPLKETMENYNNKFIVGSIPTKQDKHIYNTGFVMNKDGEIIFKQHKIHPYDYELHLTEAYPTLHTKEINKIKSAITICWDTFEGELENAINKGAQLILSPTLFTIYASTLKYSHDKAKDLRQHIYFACSTMIPQGRKRPIKGGSFIIGPNIDKILQKEGHLIKKIDITKLKKPTHKIKQIILNYKNNPHYSGYSSLNKAYELGRYSYKNIKKHEIIKK
jgi:predicted amidohydrolase